MARTKTELWREVNNLNAQVRAEIQAWEGAKRQIENIRTRLSQLNTNNAELFTEVDALAGADEHERLTQQIRDQAVADGQALYSAVNGLYQTTEFSA